MSADIAKAFNVNVQRGAFVSEVLPNSGSAKAGVKSGDVIVSLNGKPLSSFAELRSRIATTEPGAKVKLGLIRDGKPLDVEVTLDKSTSSSASAELIAPALQGATLSDGQLKDGTKGIRVDTVEKEQPRRAGWPASGRRDYWREPHPRAVHCGNAQGGGKQTGGHCPADHPRQRHALHFTALSICDAGHHRCV